MSTGYAKVTTQRPLRIPRMLIAAARDVGFDPLPLAEDTDCSPEGYLVMEPSAARHLLAEVAARAPDDAFGASFGARVSPELFGVVGLAAMSAEGLGDALARLARYKVMLTGDRMMVAPSGSEVVVILVRGEATRDASWIADLELAFLAAFARTMTRPPIAALRASLERSKPEVGSVSAKYEEAFGCPVTFDASNDSIVFDVASLDAPLVSSNRGLSPLLDGHADRELARWSDDWRERVRDAIVRALPSGVPSIHSVARVLATSSRTLQRELAARETSFSELVEHTRRDLAVEYLARDVQADEIAFLLGFARPSSFYRAFQRWHGVTPREHIRRKH